MEQVLVSLTDGGALCATLPDGRKLVHHDVADLARELYGLGWRADTVQSLDWHLDPEHAPASSEKIRLKVELRRLAGELGQMSGSYGQPSKSP